MTAQILVVDDVPANVKLLEAKLAKEYYDVITAADGFEALEQAKKNKPDIILLDVMMPGMDGFELCTRIHATDSNATTPVVFVIGTLMIPITVILVPVYLVVTQLGMINSLWAVILPGAATPTGVFLLRQYMLTIPKDLIEAARMDNASEWVIYSKVVVPLAMPAIAVLAIFSIMWRWNEFLWPLIVLNRSEVYTLQVGLNAFQGELDVQWHYILAMTVVTLIPVVVVFAFLQKFITTGIASSGMK